MSQCLHSICVCVCAHYTIIGISETGFFIIRVRRDPIGTFGTDSSQCPNAVPMPSQSVPLKLALIGTDFENDTRVVTSPIT